MIRIPVLFFLAAGLLLVPAACAPYSGPPGPYTYDAEVHIDLFFDTLSPYGDWIQLHPHGWVWIPAHIGPHWRPYTEGHWVYTAYGWTWVSDWPWGWAPFHYGRWLHHRPHGWVWIPGRLWGPAWVAWRHGDGWVGWAPLPPGVHWRAGIGLDLGGVDLTLTLGSNAWVFLPERHLLDRRPSPHYVPLQRHDQLLRITRDVTRYRAEDRRAVENGFPVQRLERELERAIPRVGVEDLRRPTAEAKPRRDGEPIKVYRPQVKPDPPRKPPVSKVKPERGSKDKGKGKGKGG